MKLRRPPSARATHMQHTEAYGLMLTMCTDGNPLHQGTLCARQATRSTWHGRSTNDGSTQLTPRSSSPRHLSTSTGSTTQLSRPASPPGPASTAAAATRLHRTALSGPCPPPLPPSPPTHPSAWLAPSVGPSRSDSSSCPSAASRCCALTGAPGSPKASTRTAGRATTACSRVAPPRRAAAWRAWRPRSRAERSAGRQPRSAEAGHRETKACGIGGEGARGLDLVLGAIGE